MSQDFAGEEGRSLNRRRPHPYHSGSEYSEYLGPITRIIKKVSIVIYT